LFVEILDENNKAVLNGTSSYRYYFLIQQSTSIYTIRHWRYWILDEKAHYKNRFSKLIGRTNDIAILPSGKITWIDVLLCDKSIIEDDGNKRVHIKQTK
jgi:phenylacetate-CoA ligase